MEKTLETCLKDIDIKGPAHSFGQIKGYYRYHLFYLILGESLFVADSKLRQTFYR